MLIFMRHNLVFLAAPKTGTTALESELRPHCSIEVRNPPGMRHMGARRYRRQWAPFLRDVHKFEGETMAVLREPLSWLQSWYRYRSRDAIKGTSRSTAGISFDQFIEAVLAEDQPDFANVGEQEYFASLGNGKIGIDHLFTYEDFDKPLAFLCDRLGRNIKVPERNVSPARPLALSGDLETELRRKRANEFALYARIAEAGHLQATG